MSTTTAVLVSIIFLVLLYICLKLWAKSTIGLNSQQINRLDTIRNLTDDLGSAESHTGRLKTMHPLARMEVTGNKGRLKSAIREAKEAGISCLRIWFT